MSFRHNCASCRNLFGDVTWIDFPLFLTLLWVWEWLRALWLSEYCTLCGSFKVWPYQSWHLNAKENAGQACSSWGPCQPDRSCVEQWIHYLNSLGANRVPVSTYALSVFQVVPSTVSTIHWKKPSQPTKQNSQTPPPHSLPFVFILYKYLGEGFGFCIVIKCGKTRLQSQVEEWNFPPTQ